MADRKIIVAGVADDPIRAIAALLNDLIDKYNAVLAKLDADAGVTDTNYAALQGLTDKVKDALTDDEV